MSVTDEKLKAVNDMEGTINSPLIQSIKDDILKAEEVNDLRDELQVTKALLNAAKNVNALLKIQLSDMNLLMSEKKEIW